MKMRNLSETAVSTVPVPQQAPWSEQTRYPILGDPTPCMEVYRREMDRLWASHQFSIYPPEVARAKNAQIRRLVDNLADLRLPPK